MKLFKMQSESHLVKEIPQPGLKQVKVDNWGTFFLQRLQQLYFEEQLLDLTIKFPTSDITVQAHRLVITTCTDYFTLLEQQQIQNNPSYDGVLIMPPDMPYECVKSIISFMYTGQLEYWTSEQNALYRTAQKMKMTVLTKLLDAQSYSSNSQTNVQTNDSTSPVSSSYKESPRVKKTKSEINNSSLPTQVLPGRKLPIWKRKLDTSPEIMPTNYDLGSFRASSLSHPIETTSGPSRFDLPEVEDYALGVFSSFDDITYDTKPIVQAPENSNNANSNINDIDDDRRNSIVSEMIHKQRNSNDFSDDEWTGPKSIMKHQDDESSSSSKKVRFDFEEKENIDKTANPPEPIDNHAKIIKEVLKKYPHLVKNNKNIRLKIMQKESKSSKQPSVSAKTKVSYVVLKSDNLITNPDESRSVNSDGAAIGPWKCSKCDLEEEYTNYYMYRRHMQDVHEQKFDPRVCEHCGYKATKRNILMYHLYTKHNVPPPKNMCFPKCPGCSYVALSETLLVRHQINHKHRPSTIHQSSTNEGSIHCMQCSQTFKDVAELASHEISTGHGTNSDKEKTHRCPHCGKTFVRMTNLHVHLDCAHKELRDSSTTQSLIPLKPSTEAEALSNVVSGIATSLGVNDQEQAQLVVRTEGNEYIVPEMASANSQGFQGQEMLMLIDGDAYEQEEEEEEEEEDNREQNTDGDMIVYIQENDVHHEKLGYTTYHSMEMVPCQEEIVEEVVEELEELEEEVIEGNSNILHEQSDSHMEDEIQYVEEETEIVEYNEENAPNSDNIDSQEAIMIIEEEQLDENDSNAKYDKTIADEWNVDKQIA